ncbi:MAG: LysR family transcriptional regulator [Cellvibrionaceae bacterium]
MKSHYPPLNALLVFLTASRVQSFTRAADALCVTRSAVSRQIKALEDYVGKPLFVRDNTNLELTPEGLRFANALSLIFSNLKIATGELMGDSDAAELRVSLSATFNAAWLMQRFPRFEEQNKEIIPCFITHGYDTGTETTDFNSSQVGVAIRLGTGQWENCHVDKLLDIYVNMCASPSLLGNAPFEDIYQLEDYNWLHYSHLPNLWEQWACSAGVPDLKTKKKNIVFDNVAVATQAVIDGLGILPCYQCFSEHLLADHRIANAYEHSMKKAESYYLLSPLNYENQWAIKKFRDWAVMESSGLASLDDFV